MIKNFQFNGRSRRCVFVERMTALYFTELESDAFPGTFLGFNQKGRFCRPDLFRRKRRCYQYAKLFADENIFDEVVKSDLKQGHPLLERRNRTGL